MNTKNNTHTTPQGRKKKKHLKRNLILLAGFLILLYVTALFLIPAFISSEKGNRMILDKINSSIEGKANFSKLSMSWFDGIKIKDITYQS